MLKASGWFARQVLQQDATALLFSCTTTIALCSLVTTHWVLRWCSECYRGTLLGAQVSPTEVYLVVNAGCREKDLAHIGKHLEKFQVRASAYMQALARLKKHLQKHAVLCDSYVMDFSCVCCANLQPRMPENEASLLPCQQYSSQFVNLCSQLSLLSGGKAWGRLVTIPISLLQQQCAAKWTL